MDSGTLHTSTNDGLLKHPMDDIKNLQEIENKAIGYQNSLLQNSMIPLRRTDILHCNYDVYDIDNEFTIRHERNLPQDVDITENVDSNRSLPQLVEMYIHQNNRLPNNITPEVIQEYKMVNNSPKRLNINNGDTDMVPNVSSSFSET